MRWTHPQLRLATALAALLLATAILLLPSSDGVTSRIPGQLPGRNASAELLPSSDRVRPEYLRAAGPTRSPVHVSSAFYGDQEASPEVLVARAQAACVDVDRARLDAELATLRTISPSDAIRILRKIVDGVEMDNPLLRVVVVELLDLDVPAFGEETLTLVERALMHPHACRWMLIDLERRSFVDSRLRPALVRVVRQYAGVSGPGESIQERVNPDPFLAFQAAELNYRIDGESNSEFAAAAEEALTSSDQDAVDRVLRSNYLHLADSERLVGCLVGVLADRRDTPLGFDTWSLTGERRHMALLAIAGLSSLSRRAALECYRRAGSPDKAFECAVHGCLGGVETAAELLKTIDSDDDVNSWVAINVLVRRGQWTDEEAKSALGTGRRGRAFVEVLRPAVTRMSRSDFARLVEAYGRTVARELVAPWWSVLAEDVRAVLSQSR